MSRVELMLQPPQPTTTMVSLVDNELEIAL
jgi:hypothetical protein